MNGKKTRLSKKNVAVAIDGDTMHKLRGAVEALSEFGAAYENAVDNRAARRERLTG